MNPSWILRLSCAATLAAHLIAALAIAEQPARRGGPDRIKAGDRAPDFTLKSPDGKQTVTLSSFRDEKPVALVFGSYT